jgi:anti-sigma regulatory factor (Ser/Thr protein kinase)
MGEFEPADLGISEPGRMTRRLTVELPRECTAPRRAREKLIGFDHGLPEERRHDAELLVSELVSNAVKYGGDGDVSVIYERDRGCFRAEVVDQGEGFVAALRDREDVYTPGGWGLPLVETLSDRWGAHEGSTHVWFEFAL